MLLTLLPLPMLPRMDGGLVVVTPGIQVSFSFTDLSLIGFDNFLQTSRRVLIISPGVLALMTARLPIVCYNLHLSLSIFLLNLASPLAQLVAFWTKYKSLCTDLLRP